jgi:hypothetical protein
MLEIFWAEKDIQADKIQSPEDLLFSKKIEA